MNKNLWTYRLKESRRLMHNLFIRSFQTIARPDAYALNWREPELLIGANPLYPVPVIFKKEKLIDAFKRVKGDYNE